MEKKEGYINLFEIIQIVKSKKKLFFISLPITIVLSSRFHRYYILIC